MNQDSDELKVFDRAWFVAPGSYGYEVRHGGVIAAGPRVIVIDIDGPWSNIDGRPTIVDRKIARRGNAPSMGGTESLADYGNRCFNEMDRPNQIAKVRAEAERLGLTVSGSDGAGVRR